MEIREKRSSRAALALALPLILASVVTGAVRARAEDGFRPMDVGLTPEETVAAMSSRSPEIDLDGDGRIDLWREFGPGGGLLRARYDTNGDGKPDETFIYEETAVTRLWDEDGDGKEDRRYIQWKNSRGGVERTQLDELRGGKWETVSTTRVLAEKDLIEIRLNENGREVVRYDRATLR